MNAPDVSDTFPELQLQGIYQSSEVQIVHPSNDYALFSLAALDRDPSGLPRYGISYRLVLDGCHVLTNGTPGYVATDAKGETPVSCDNNFLAAGRYFYFVGTRGEPKSDYNIVYDFDAWLFSMPAHWSRRQSQEERARCRPDFSSPPSYMSEFVKTKDERCLITKYLLPSCDNAHLIPKEEISWFVGNDMELHNNNPSASINDSANGITLRSDIHCCLDRHSFVLFPVGDEKFMTYVVRGTEVDYAGLFHRRLVTIPTRVADEFVYARFAYCIIKQHRHEDFLNRALPINVKVQTATETLLKEKANKRKRTSLETFETIVEQPGEMAETRTAADARDTLELDSNVSFGSSSAGTMLKLQPGSQFADPAKDEGWKQRVIEQYPEYVEEVADPPETRFGAHIDTPRMLRLMDEYVKKNPQVYLKSTSPTEDWDMTWDNEVIESPYE